MIHKKMKLDFNNWVRFVDEVIDADNLLIVEKNANAISMGLFMLYEYMKELAQYAINSNDEYLLEWCQNLMIVKKTEE